MLADSRLTLRTGQDPRVFRWDRFETGYASRRGNPPHPIVSKNDEVGQSFFAVALTAASTSRRSPFPDILRQLLHAVDRNTADQHEGVRGV